MRERIEKSKRGEREERQQSPEMSEMFVRWSAGDILLRGGGEKVIAVKHSYSALNDLASPS